VTERQEELFSGNVYCDSGSSLFFKELLLQQDINLTAGFTNKSFGYKIHPMECCFEAGSAKEAIYKGMVSGCSI